MNWKYYKRWNDIEEILAAFRRWKREDTEKNINGESGIMKKKWNYAETLKETVIQQCVKMPQSETTNAV